MTNTAHIFHLEERAGLKTLEKQFLKTENDLKTLQGCGQIVGEVLRRIDEERCTFLKLKSFTGGKLLQNLRQLMQWGSASYC